MTTSPALQECNFSVVIATLDRPVELARCLLSIGGVEFPRDRFEVIVVNDGGEVAAEANLRSLAGDVRVRLLSQKNRGAAAARNAGVAISRGEFIAFIDDDCVVPRDWLQQLRSATAAFPHSLIGGRTLNLISGNRFSQASQRLVEYVCSYYNEPGTGRTPFFASNNIVVRRDALLSVGGFDETFRFAEDRDLCLRWHAKGRTFHYADSLIVHHGHALTLSSFARQHFSYGRGALPYRKRAKGDGGLRIEPFGFYSGMLALPFRSGDRDATIISLLIIIAQLSNAAGFAYELARSGPLVDHATLHHEGHLLRTMNVGEGISGNRDNIGELPRLD